MKIAIFHDYFSAVGGAEKLVIILAKGLDADIITTDFEDDIKKKLDLEGINIISIGKNLRGPLFKSIDASLKFNRCDFSKKYDFFIFSGNWTIYAAKKHKPNLWYCNSPTRVFYDLKEINLKNQKTIFHRFISRLWIYIHSHFDKKTVKNFDFIIANSQNVLERINKYYNRNSQIVYPSIETNRYFFSKFGDYWLSVNRLYPEKRIDLQIKVFDKLPYEKLKIVGGYSKKDNVKKSLNFLNKLPENIELLGEISEKELIELYANCRGLITTAIDEDFGLTPLEAMASGKPVIAVNEGGYKETILDGITGKLVLPEENEIIQALKEISKNPERYKEACLERAKLFDSSIFIVQMKEEIQRVLK